MTLCLALDTATDLASVAVGDATGALAEVAVGGRRGAGALTPAVSECLRLAGIEYAALERILVADGPGSFTGLRIGFATAQGMARELDLPSGTAPSLMVAAWRAAPGDGVPVLALFDALRGQVFAAMYAFSAAAVTVHLDPTLTTVEALRDDTKTVPGAVTGDGADAYGEAIAAWIGRRPLPSGGGPRAAALLSLQRLDGSVTEVDDLAEFEPTYGRMAEAQARWEREHGRSLPHSPS